MAGAEAVSHHDKQSTGALLARFPGLGCFDDRSVEPGFPHFQVVFTDEPSVPSVYPAVPCLGPHAAPAAFCASARARSIEPSIPSSPRIRRR
jgi:hypothetical protein